jgi:hypothetical protein
VIQRREESRLGTRRPDFKEVGREELVIWGRGLITKFYFLIEIVVP